MENPHLNPIPREKKPKSKVPFPWPLLVGVLGAFAGFEGKKIYDLQSDEARQIAIAENSAFQKGYGEGRDKGWGDGYDLGYESAERTYTDKR